MSFWVSHFWDSKLYTHSPRSCLTVKGVLRIAEQALDEYGWVDDTPDMDRKPTRCACTVGVHVLGILSYTTKSRHAW